VSIQQHANEDPCVCVHEDQDINKNQCVYEDQSVDDQQHVSKDSGASKDECVREYIRTLTFAKRFMLRYIAATGSSHVLHTYIHMRAFVLMQYN